MRDTAILIPCLGRPEYTELCLNSLYKDVPSNVIFYFVDEGQNADVIANHAREFDIVIHHEEPIGLRNTIIEFFTWVKLAPQIKYIGKIDNDCIVPDGWIKTLSELLDLTDRDIISPNVFPSNAAFLYGKDDNGLPYRPSEFVGGLWFMRASLIQDINFESFESVGIRGAFNLLKQIILEKDAKCAWAPQVTIQDVGHWSGSHPLHIKNKEHEEYSAYVGRRVSWTA